MNIQAASPRALSANQLSTMVHQEAITMGIASFKDSPMEKTVGRAVRESLRLLSIEGSSHSTAAETKGTLVVVCGSAFLMSEARAAVGIIEPRD